MATYYEHTMTEKAEVPYTFRCEHCLKDSGSMWATITGKANLRSNYNTLKEKQEERLRREAHISLVSKVKALHKDVVEKQIYPKDFSDDCPHCHKPQSWAVSNLKKKLFKNPIIALCVGAFCSLIALGESFDETTHISLSSAAWILAAGAAVALVLLIWNLAKLNIKMKKTASGGQKNMPVIDWAAVQSLLDETF